MKDNILVPNLPMWKDKRTKLEIFEEGRKLGNYEGKKECLKLVDDLINNQPKQIKLDFDEKPIMEEDYLSGKKEFAYCGGCNRFVIEEDCICSLINIKEILKLKQVLKGKEVEE